MGRRVFPFSLRPEKDDDLINIISLINKNDREILKDLEPLGIDDVSGLVRKGLRLILKDLLKVNKQKDVEKAPPRTTKWSFPK